MTQALVDVVVVTYESARHVGACVSPLSNEDGITVVVVDNASCDGSVAAAEAAGARTIERLTNDGFGVGCNLGWRSGEAPYVLFLNPDARMTAADVLALASGLERNPRAGAAGPLITDPDGTLDGSQRQFPSLLSDLAQALFLHRLFPRAAWTDGTLRDPRHYEAPREAAWLSGAALMLRRSMLEQLDGFDERFFLYCEDMDLCKRVQDAGYSVRFDPSATCVHVGGASAPRARTLPVLAASRRLYAQKHFGAARKALDRAVLAGSSLLHAVGPSRGGLPVRAAHLRSLAVYLYGAR